MNRNFLFRAEGTVREKRDQGAIVRGGDANRQRLSRFLPPHPLIHPQGHATLELHDGLGRVGSNCRYVPSPEILQNSSQTSPKALKTSFLVSYSSEFVLSADAAQSH